MYHSEPDFFVEISILTHVVPTENRGIFIKECKTFAVYRFDPKVRTATNTVNHKFQNFVQ